LIEIKGNLTLFEKNLPIRMKADFFIIQTMEKSTSYQKESMDS